MDTLKFGLIAIPVLTIFLLHIGDIEAIFSTQWPVSVSQFENSDVEFYCEVHEKGNWDHLVWFVDMNPTDSILTLTFANKTTELEEYNDELHGQHSIVYEVTSAGVHKLTYRITGIKLADDGVYACGFVPLPLPPFVSADNVLGDDATPGATLQVLVAPTDRQPRCDIGQIDLSSFTQNSVLPVTFSCALAGGKPEPALMWYRTNDSISTGVSEFNELTYTLSADDNGVEFTCVGSGDSLVENVSCSIVPLLITPTASIISSSVHIAAGGNVSFSCFGGGLPRVSKIEWFVNGVSADEITGLDFEMSVNLTATDSSSELDIFNAQFERENNKIECVVKVPSGLTSKTAVTLLYKRNKTSSLLANPLLSIIAAISGLLVTILVTFIAISVCRHIREREEPEGIYHPGEPVDTHVHINPYQESVIDTFDNQQQQPAEGYVLNHLPGPGGSRSTATMGSEHPYATIERGAAPYVIHGVQNA